MSSRNIRNRPFYEMFPGIDRELVDMTAEGCSNEHAIVEALISISDQQPSVAGSSSGAGEGPPLLSRKRTLEQCSWSTAGAADSDDEMLPEVSRGPTQTDTDSDVEKLPEVNRGPTQTDTCSTVECIVQSASEQEQKTVQAVVDRLEVSHASARALVRGSKYPHDVDQIILQWCVRLSRSSLQYP